jgi:HlyD family secretion protein
MTDQLPMPTAEDVLRDIGKPKSTGMKRVLRILAIAVATVLVVGGVVVWRMKVSATAPLKYLTTKVTRGDLASTVSATGTLRGKDTVIVGAEISGRMKTVAVDFNDKVTKGQLLAEIDSTLLRANLNQVTAQLASARSELKNRQATALQARLTADRTRALIASGLAPKQQGETAEADAARASAAVESAKSQIIVAVASVASTRTSLGKTEIRSPIDGVVLSRNIDPGQTIAATMSAPELFKLTTDLTQMEITVAIDEADIGRTRQGQRATFVVDAFPDRRFESKVISIHNVAVTKDNVVTYEALLGVRNDGLLLRPGMTATTSIETERRQGVLLVPNAALRFSPATQVKKNMFSGPPGSGKPTSPDGKPRVWVLRDGSLVEHLVRLGPTDGVNTEVRETQLAEGDAVVTDMEQGKAK